MNEFEERREAAKILGKAGGSVRSEKKAKAVRENGKRGGRPLKKRYYFLSGEGEQGHWESHLCTLPQARRIAGKLRASGDRWCTIWEEDHIDRNQVTLRNIDSGDMREVPVNAITRL